MLKISETTRKNDLRIFGVSEWDARQVLTKADATSVVESDGVLHTVAVRKTGSRALLAVASGREGKPTVSSRACTSSLPP